MRHNFATNVTSKGISLFALQQLLDHENPSTTQRYITNNKNVIDQEYNKIED